MKRINLLVGGILCGFLCLPASASAEVCSASGDSLRNAKAQYARSCSMPLQDCDPVNGRWHCSSENVNSTSVFSVQQAVPQTVPAASSISTSAESQSTITAQSSTINKDCVDTDGDGWGWDGSKSCRVTSPLTSPIRDITIASTGSFNLETNRQCEGNYHPGDITDLILVTGQSNVTGAETEVSATLDRWGQVIEFHAPDQSHPRVFAWTVDPQSANAGTGWEVASLTQSWHDSNPGVGGIARNSFAFHFGKQVVDHSDCRVVGLITVSEGGKGISHWDDNAPGWNEVVSQVSEALSAIGRSSIDGILWHQGESDWIVDGTCYGSERCQNNQPDYYAQKLYSRIANPALANPIGKSALIDRLRRTPWYGEGKPFIAGETVKAPVNLHLNKLNTDSDPWTACVDSDIDSGLGIRDDDPFKNHYDADGLRELGARYANTYLKMTNQ